jgi:N-acetylglucosamine kinase
MPLYFLGLDGGQSSTTALVGDESGRVLGMGRGGPCNHVSAAEARDKFRRVIGGCVAEALAAAALSADTPFESACFGFSGGPADKQTLVDELFVMARRSVTNDAVIALTGAHAGLPGIITIAGTGSISLGRSASGAIMRAGGWGYVFGDEGGGFDLTRQALRAALRMEEGWGPPTTLRDALLKTTGAKDAGDLLHRCYTPELPRPRIAAFSRLVDAAAADGDRVAQGILDEAAQQLAGITLAVRGKLFGGNDQARIAYVGGAFQSQRLLARFRNLLECGGMNSVRAPRHPPAAGALLEAYRLAELTVELSDVPEREK